MPTRTFPKGSAFKVTPDFQAHEFDCHCECCSSTAIDEDLCKKLQKMRDILKTPIHVNSGFRCSNKQCELREAGYETAHGLSRHELGKAADIQTGKHSGVELAQAAREAGFRAVGIGATWVHVDTRSDHDRSWHYVKR